MQEIIGNDGYIYDKYGNWINKNQIIEYEGVW